MCFRYALQHVSNEKLTEDAANWQKECRRNIFIVFLLALLLFVFSRVTLIVWLSDKFAGKIDGHTKLFCKTNEREIDCVVDIDVAAKNTSSMGCTLNYNNNVYELCGMLCNCHTCICKSNKCENTNR